MVGATGAMGTFTGEIGKKRQVRVYTRGALLGSDWARGVRNYPLIAGGFVALTARSARSVVVVTVASIWSTVLIGRLL